MPSSDVTPDGLATASSLQLSDVVLGGDINILRPKKDVCSEYLAYYLTNNKHQIIRLVTGTTIKHLYNKDLVTLSLTLPSCHTEQTKIANCLAAIDRKIDAVAEQITLTQTFKQGLLQQMFV